MMQPFGKLFGSRWTKGKKTRKGATNIRQVQNLLSLNLPLPPPPTNALSSCFFGSHWREAAWKKKSSQLGGEQWEDFGGVFSPLLSV